MPLPKRLTRFNRNLTNKVTLPFAGHLAGFGVVRHKGRKTGYEYETPVNCWISGDVVTIALTYGTTVDWLKNLEANAGGEIVVRGLSHRLGVPIVLSTAEGMSRMPLIPRWVLPRLGVADFREFPILSEG